MDIASQLQALLDQYGWGRLLHELDQIARDDGFSALCKALEPIHKLINEDFEELPPSP
jgi:hypothetical protein